MKDQELVELLNSARMISAAENVIYPLLKDKIAQRLDLACAEFRGGKTENLIAHIGYITGLKDMLNEMRKIQTAGNKAQIQLIDKN